MAESPSMTTPEVVAKREAVAIVARELMGAEITSEIGAAGGEVSAERATHRNGYRERLWETRVGEISLGKEGLKLWLMGFERQRKQASPPVATARHGGVARPA